MNFPHKQRGLGFAGWIFLIMIFGSVMAVGAKLVPVYMDYNTLSNLLDGLAAEPGHGGKPPNMIKELIESRLKVNGIREFDFKNNLKIKRNEYGAEVIVDYEVRMNVVKNLDLIAAFNKEVELRDN